MTVQTTLYINVFGDSGISFVADVMGLDVTFY